MAAESVCKCLPHHKESVLTLGARGSGAYQTVPWLILVLDGGGIRGYASLLILKEIMTRCRTIEYNLDKSAADGSEDVEPDLSLPCHYFDYMIGTSTGG